MEKNAIASIDKSDRESQKPSVRINAAMVPKVNLAFYQNSVPVIVELSIVNDSDNQLKDVELTLSSSGFFKTKIWRADIINPGQTFHFTGKALDIPLDSDLLANLTESESTKACFALTSSQEEVASLEVPIELLARNQWGGIGHMPEMIAAFVQPNEPAVDHVLKKAARVLRKNGKNSALNGYEWGPKHAWELASAIWSSVCSMELDYSLPPANFETSGQKIRQPGQVLEAGIATCMDISLLFCAAIEQCGLNPLLVFTKGHVFAGVWLKNEEFTTALIDDVTALRKRLKLRELALFETTLTTEHPCPNFGRAIQVGEANISEDEEDKFELAIDIRRARLQRIKPLASEQTTIPLTEAQGVPAETEPIFEEAPDLPDDDIARQEELEPTQPQSRLDKWQRKLLDLSLRNSLLNFRTTKRAIKFEAPNPGLIEDLLADGQTLKILPDPELMEGLDLRSQAIHDNRTREVSAN